VEAVVERLQSFQINGRRVKCEVAQGSQYVPGDGDITSPNGLFIGNIDYSVTKDALTTLISNAIGASSIERLVMQVDSGTGYNSGHCHLFLSSPEIIDTAIEKLQGLHLLGRGLRVDRTRLKAETDYRRERRTMYAPNVNNANNSSANPHSNCEIFIANFPLTVNEQSARDLLDELVGPGTYRKIRFLVRENGDSKGFAFIEFVNEAAASLALSKLDGLDINGKRLRAEPAATKRKSQRPQGHGEEVLAEVSRPTDLKIMNMNVYMTEEQIYNLLCEVIGKDAFKGVRYICDKEMEAFQGYVYVEFSSLQEAEAAAAKLGGLEVMGNALRTKLVVPKDQMRQPSTHYVNNIISAMPHEVFVHGLHPEINEDMLIGVVYDLVKTGNGFDVRVIRNKENPAMNKGFAFINFQDPADGERAIQELNGIQLYGKTISAKHSHNDASASARPSSSQPLPRSRHSYTSRHVVPPGAAGVAVSETNRQYSTSSTYHTFEDCDLDFDFFSLSLEASALDELE
jgi:RNA recognition motif-containing protein